MGSTSRSTTIPSVSLTELAELAELAVNLACRAGDVALKLFQRGPAIETKADGTPVTAADRAAEELLRSEIARHCPGDALLGEEYGAEDGTSGRVWIVDPIDGTRSFVHGVPLFSTLVGLEIDGVTALGVIRLPALDETVVAYRGGGCRWNGEPAKVSSTATLAESLLNISEMPSDPGQLAALFAEVGLRRTWADAYGYALVATGRAEIMIDPEISIWDIAAIQPIVEEAGGRFSDLDGVATIRGRGAVGTNGLLHEAVLETLAS